MRLELAVAKRERDFYLQKVEQAKQIEKMAFKDKPKGGAKGEGKKKAKKL